MDFKQAEIQSIQSLIVTFRGCQVMLDRDLAELYQVETKVLNQAVKRNLERFPENFRFQLSDSEYENWRSQFVTSNSDRMGLRRPPFAFTEQGIAMLSAVLRSKVAIKASIQIMNAFVEMRKILLSNQGLFQRMESVERKLLIHDYNFEKVFQAIETSQLVPSQGIFFEGQIFDAYFFVSKIISLADSSLILIDNYLDESVFTLFGKKKRGVKVTFLTKEISRQVALDVKKANEQYGDFQINEFKLSHDRFLIVDGKDIYHIGASIKDLGKKWFAFTKLKTETVTILEKVHPYLSNYS
jgi:hypothetical protein